MTTVKELKHEAKRKGLREYSNLKKVELLDLLRNREFQGCHEIDFRNRPSISKDQKFDILLSFLPSNNLDRLKSSKKMLEEKLKERDSDGVRIQCRNIIGRFDRVDVKIFLGIIEDYLSEKTEMKTLFQFSPGKIQNITKKNLNQMKSFLSQFGLNYFPV